MNFHILFSEKYTSWAELESSIELIECPKEKGTVFEEFVFAYFTYYKDIYQIAELYMESSIPPELRERVRLERRDSGVDGLIVKEDGTTVAYQAKFRSGQAAPSYDELTSFWSESEHADERCIVANCYELPQQAYKKKSQFTILRDELNSLDLDFFKWLHIFATTGVYEKEDERYTPLPHQQKMIDEVLEGFQTERRGKMLAACGTGKTLTALWIKEELSAKNVLFVVPNLALIKQTLEAWMPQAQEPFIYLCVCSDTSVANVQHADDDSFQPDASYIDVPVTTDSEKIARFINFQTDKDKVIFSTYHSLDAIVAALGRNEGFTFDIAFFDEAHRTAGTKDTQMFIMGMNDSFIPAQKRLFMTATERIVNPRIVGRAREYNYEVFSMDNYEQYGVTFTSLPFRSAIDKKIISDYKIVVCCTKEEELKSIIDNDLLLNVGNRNVDSQNLFKQVLLAKTMNDLGIKKIISYHRDIRTAQQFISPEEGTPLDEVISGVSKEIATADVYCDHINGTMQAGKRKRIFDEFVATPFGVISNARCLTEGIDVPIIDAVYFADPKNSIIDIIQAVGRSLRTVDDNPEKVSYIIIPIIIADDVSSFEDIEPENFSTLHSVVQALRDQDRILADYIDKLNLKLATGKKVEDEGSEDVPLIIEVSEELNIDDIAEKILLRVAEVNRDPANISPEFKFEAEARASGVRRGNFTTIGDYTLPSYWCSCIQATLEKYETFEIGLPRAAIKVDNNNVSHAEKMGALIQRENKFYVTDVGRRLFDCSTFDEAIPILQEQLLKFHKRAIITHFPYFPYRYALKILSQVESLSKFEFAYSLFIAKDLGERGVTDACERIFYLRDTYPRIDSLSETNKKIVLNALNEKYDTTFKFTDMWSSRTTLYNQFNYLKRHLEVWPGIITPGTSNIVLAEGGASLIEDLLSRTSLIETCPNDRLTPYFTTFQDWLGH
ncbi:MAG: AlwI family type II restriction endonuclease [Clostridiaceae bacterium]|nr:AlwI family type II restriction endonuclease [Clostridiaceae bacterium]